MSSAPAPVTLAEVASAAREVAAAARGSPVARKAWLVAAYLDALLNPMSSDELYELRLSANLSQTEFAAHLGVSQPTVSDMERDVRPVTARAALLARALARAAARQTCS
jgi:DNA-binding transcriptional regulator YiaG